MLASTCASTCTFRHPSWSPNQSAFASQPVAKRTIQTTGPTHAFADDARCVDGISEAPNESDASHELFVPFSACQLRCAIRGSRPPDDPASALLSGLRPARPLCRWPASPLRFFAIADAMRLCSMADLSVRFSQSDRGGDATALRTAFRIRLVIDCSRGHRSGKPIRYCARERPVTSSDLIVIRARVSTDTRSDAIDNPVHPLPKPGHAPTRSLARCTATRRPEPSQPGWSSGPSLGTSTSGAHGVHFSSQV
jgi:hypothetical protein